MKTTNKMVLEVNILSFTEFLVFIWVFVKNLSLSTVQSETDPNSGQKISKFQILLRSIDYLEFLKQQNDAQDAELTRLKKEYRWVVRLLVIQILQKFVKTDPQ